MYPSSTYAEIVFLGYRLVHKVLVVGLLLLMVEESLTVRREKRCRMTTTIVPVERTTARLREKGFALYLDLLRVAFRLL